MHQLAGLTWSEWLSVIGIVTFLAGLISLLFKYAVFAPFQVDIKELNKNFTLLNSNLKILQDEIKTLKSSSAEHDRRLDRHHVKIKNLEKEVNQR